MYQLLFVLVNVNMFKVLFITLIFVLFSALDYNSTTDFEAVVGYNEVTLLLLVLTITAITLLFVAMLSMMYMKKVKICLHKF